MWIYKITNIQNNKVYIGQTIRPVKDRFNRHINDALNNIIDTHFARAIRKHGKENFQIEIIDTAQNQNELNEKERYWIQYYNSVKEGYNETASVRPLFRIRTRMNIPNSFQRHVLRIRPNYRGILRLFLFCCIRSKQVRHKLCTLRRLFDRSIQEPF